MCKIQHNHVRTIQNQNPQKTVSRTVFQQDRLRRWELLDAFSERPEVVSSGVFLVQAILPPGALDTVSQHAGCIECLSSTERELNPLA